MHVHGNPDGRAALSSNVDIGKRRAQEMSTPVGIKKPRAIATALMAWLTAPAPTDCMLTGTPSFTIPAMAPATDAGDDLLETLR
jgi:hypothetical protein